MATFSAGEHLNQLRAMLMHDMVNDKSSYMGVIPNAPKEAIKAEGLDMNLITRTAEAEIGQTEDYVNSDVLELDVTKATIAWEYITTKPMKTDKDQIRAAIYNPESEIRTQNSRALMNAYRRFVLHGIAPDANTAKMPVLRTSGAADSNGRRRCTVNDLIDYQDAFRAVENLDFEEDLYMNLCRQHVTDLMIDTKSNQDFRSMYHNMKKGTPLDLYGFKMLFGNQGKVIYNETGTKLAVQATTVATDQEGSVAFWAPNVVKAVGNLENHYDPSSQDTMSNPPKSKHRITGYVLGARKQDEAVGALVSDNA